MSPVISVKQLGKRYELEHRSPRSSPMEWLRRPWCDRQVANTSFREEFWALQDVSFEVAAGERLGIIGRNGAGKSTLLKILSRIVAPSKGEVRIRGRVASLLEVGTGFHPELTGRENIFLNGAVLGMSRDEIRRKFDAIVDFAEVEKFLDTPVKHYSSGMYVRLAFAVAAHLESDILIADEVLAVGDIDFQNKCLGKMRDIGQGGRTVLFVSHNFGAIRNLCTRALLINNGNLIADDCCNLVIESYLKNCRNLAATPLHNRKDRSGTGDIRITAIAASNGQDTSHLQPGRPLVISCAIEFNSTPPASGLSLAIGIDDFSGNRVALLNSEITGPASLPITATTHSIDVVIDKLPLVPGHYRLTIFCSANGKILDWIQDAAIIVIENNDYYGTGKLPISGQGQLLLDYRFVCRSLSHT